MLLGVHEQYQDGPNRTTPVDTQARYPHLAITREFKGGIVKPQNLIPSLRNLCQDVWDAGLVCNVSFKFSKADVFNGQWQIYIEQMARYLTDNELTGKTVLTIWHEPEDDARDSFPNGMKPNKVPEFESGVEFVKYFNTVHRWLKGVNQQIVTSHAALGYGYRPKIGGPRDKSAYVTHPAQWVTECDIDAIDIYSGRSFPLNMTLGNSEAFKRWRDSRATATTWGVSERGWIADAMKYDERNASIAAEAEWLAALPDNERPAFYIVWTTEGVENDPKIILDSTGRDAVNDMFSKLKQPPAEEPAPEQPKMGQCPLCQGSGKVPTDQTFNVIMRSGNG